MVQLLNWGKGSQAINILAHRYLQCRAMQFKTSCILVPGSTVLLEKNIFCVVQCIQTDCLCVLTCRTRVCVRVLYQLSAKTNAGEYRSKTYGAKLGVGHDGFQNVLNLNSHQCQVAYPIVRNTEIQSSVICGIPSQPKTQKVCTCQ